MFPNTCRCPGYLPVDVLYGLGNWPLVLGNYFCLSNWPRTHMTKSSCFLLEIDTLANAQKPLSGYLILSFSNLELNHIVLVIFLSDIGLLCKTFWVKFSEYLHESPKSIKITTCCSLRAVSSLITGMSCPIHVTNLGNMNSNVHPKSGPEFF